MIGRAEIRLTKFEVENLPPLSLHFKSPRQYGICTFRFQVGYAVCEHFRHCLHPYDLLYQEDNPG
jgi:hypothetical protein